MHHVAGLEPCQWIFILEGIATFVIGAIAFFALFDYPATASFINKDEKAEVLRRLEDNCRGLADTFR